MAVSPDGEKLVVQLGNDGQGVDFDNDRLSVIDIARGQFALAAEVKLDDEPPWGRPGISSDSRLAYVVTDRRKSEHASLYEISFDASLSSRTQARLPRRRSCGASSSASDWGRHS